MDEYITYNQESGFNIIKAKSMEDAQESCDILTIVLDRVDEVDEVILNRIRELLS